MPRPKPAPAAGRPPAAPSPDGPALVWFRRDLRLADNQALHAALARHGAVIPVYVHSPADEGAWAPGAASNWWLHHSLEALAGSLEGKGSTLVLREAQTAQAGLDALIQDTGARAIYWNAVFEPAFRARDEALIGHFEHQGLEATSCGGALLTAPTTLRTKAGGDFHMYAPYWRALQAWLAEHPDADQPLPAPARLPAPPKGLASLPLARLGLLPRLGWAARFAEHGTPGEAGAQARLKVFAERVLANYLHDHNVPAVDGSSLLSAPLHFGELTPRQLWAATPARPATPAGGSGKAVSATERTAFLREVGWRDFTHHLLWHFPALPDRAMTERFDKVAWRYPDRDPDARRDYQAWTRGQTGYPIVDAGMRQLWLTGFLPNRLRLLTAMALVKNLLIDWRAGEKWYWDTLVDADLANNSYNWQWVAGSSADPNPFFRLFNPVTQAQKFDPAGDYVRRWVPEVARLPPRYVHAPWTAPASVLAAAGIAADSPYRRPIFDVAESRARALDAYKVVRKAAVATAS